MCLYCFLLYIIIVIIFLVVSIPFSMDFHGCPTFFYGFTLCLSPGTTTMAAA